MALMKETVDFTGVSGEAYRFNVSSKSTELSDAGGIYILTYCHPRGHLAGFQVNVLRMGTTVDLNSAILELRQDENLMEECWNYTCTLPLDDPDTRDEYLEDLCQITSAQC